MELEFTKMQGLGNDFVVINALDQPFKLSAEQLRFIANRRFGVGCDQVLLIEPPRSQAVDFTYRIFNADGGEVEQCGNGARCFARYVREEGLSDRDELAVETKSGIITLKIEANDQVTVDMGRPEFSPPDIPFEADGPATRYALEVAGQTVEIGAVSIGNPHAVMRVEDVDTAPVQQWGPLIEAHAHFPQRVNAGFMQVVDAHHIRLRVYERGVGETLACGTGACAAVAVGRQQGLLSDKVEVALAGGQLLVQWSGPEQNIYITGPATRVFEGKIKL